jgi:hypothetical protein
MKLDIIFHYNVDEHTGEITYIGKEEITVDTGSSSKTTKKSTKKVEESSEPIVTLESNKLVLTQAAVDLLQLDDRVDVRYDKFGNPLIGAFDGKGNKLTKSNTVSFRGAANTKLSSFGTVFKLEPYQDGAYYLIGDKNKIDEVPEEIINIENDIDILDELNIEVDDVTNFEFKL